MYKKLLLCLLAFTLVGCGGSTDSTDNENNESEEVVEETEINSSEITMEMLLATEPASEDDFETLNNEVDMTCTITAYLGPLEIIVIPEVINGYKVTKIATFAFANDFNVKAISLPDSIEELEKNVFALNENLELVDLGDGLKIIGEGAFFGCENLTSLTLPEGLETISSSAIWSKGIERIEIPSSVSYIGERGLGGIDLIIGESGSVAEEYALEYGIEFQVKE